MTDKDRWIKNESLLKQADYFDCYRKFETIVYGMETKGWKPRVMEVRRSRARQLVLLARGYSRTWNSKHLTGRAMDVIDSRWAWKLLPVEFTADLALLAHQQGLTTGALGGLKGESREVRQQTIVSGNRERLIQLLYAAQGWDCAHCEVI